MLGLKNKCLHATTQEPYILRSSGGTDNSIEGLAVSSPSISLAGASYWQPPRGLRNMT